ncbi:4Fe-4S binding protein, partial [Aduncisulcus paluster]
MKRILNKFLPDTETGEFLKQALEDRNLTMKDSGRISQRQKKRQKLKDDFAQSYHGKVIPTEEAIKLVKIKKQVRTTLPERVLPYEKARDIILQHPDHIVLFECPCRASREKPCYPLDVCMIVGEPFASFVAKNHPEKSRRITEDEAERIL